MFGAPQPTSYDVRFVLFRIPISITPFFWLIGSLLAYSFANNPSEGRLDPMAFAIALLAILISIVVHELGHGLVIRYVFGASTMIFLHGLGGVAIHDNRFHYRTPRRWGRIFISFAGPLAGFLLSGISLGVILLLLYKEMFVKDSYLTFFLLRILEIGIVWGILNLMPIYPLDGGKIFREICLQVSQRHGMEFSAGVSAVTAILLTLLCIRFSPFMAILFAVMAWQSIQMLQSRRF